MPKYKLILFSALAVCFLTQCQQPTGTEALVNIPSFNISCTSSNCASSSSHPRLFIYITTSGCLNITYGQVATGTGFLNCSGGACTGPNLSWTNTSGASITQIASGTYDICGIIDITGSYAGSVPPGDATSSLSNAVIGSDSISLTNWINGAFVSNIF